MAPLLALALAIMLVALPARAQAQGAVLPGHLRDRGLGVPASMFATYISRGQLLLFPFVAYSRDKNREYQPARLGYGLNEDFRGRYRSSERQLFVSYGFTDRLAVEVEASILHATLDKAPNDSSATPARIEESGFGDIEGQLRLRLATESERRPEIFGYLEVTAPTQRRAVLLGDRIWEFRPGIGLIRGFSWGTMTARVNGEYNHEAGHWDLGEFSIEYLKRLSPAWRVNLALEGGETASFDEWDLVSGVQWRIRDGLFLKLDNAIGLSSKATDWAPQLGLMLSFPN